MYSLLGVGCSTGRRKRAMIIKRRFVVPLAILLTAISPLLAQYDSQPSQQLIDDVIWSIAHEGCDVFRGNVMRSGAELRECFASHQQTGADSALITSTTVTEIVRVTLIALPRIYDDYSVVLNFEWVMTHEGQAKRLQGLAEHGNFQDIRSIYQGLQAHNPLAVNALSALSDDDINNILSTGS